MDDAGRRDETPEESLQQRQSRGHEGRSLENWARDIAQHADRLENLNGRVTSLEHAIAVDAATKAMMGELLAKHDRMLVGDGDDAGMRTELIILRRAAEDRSARTTALLVGVIIETVALIGTWVTMAIQAKGP
jgi:hypothetical protein